MPTEDSFKAIRKVIKTYHPIQKDQHKYILSLATGTLIFSVTFVEKIAPIPVYKWLIISGWIFLLLSIVSGIVFINTLYHSMVTMDSMISFIEDKDATSMIVKEGFLERRMMEPFLSSDVVKGSMEKQGMQIQDDAIEKYKNELLENQTFLTEFKKQLLTSGDKLSTDAKELIEMRRAYFRLVDKIKDVVPHAHPTTLFKKMRQLMIWTPILSSSTYYLFYAGVLMITIFTIINFSISNIPAKSLP